MPAYHRLLVAPGKRPPHPLDCRDDIDAGAPDGVSDPFAAFDGDGAKERPVAGIVPLRDHRSHRRLVLLGRVAMPGAGSRSRRRTIDALWTAVDLTEIEAARQAAEAATVRLTDMIETAPIGLFRADRRGRLLHANDTLADWLGVDAADLVARKARLAEFELARGGGSEAPAGEAVAADRQPAGACQWRAGRGWRGHIGRA